MKNTLSRSLGFALGCALALLVFAADSRAQTSTFTYQGNLTNGGALANGGYDLQFKLYDQLSGGALQGSPSTVTVSGVTVTAGVFTVELDFGAAAFPGAARFLEISVRPAGSGGFTTLSPRQQLSSTPYAIRSLSAATADAAANATSATNATYFSGPLGGDVTGTQGTTTVAMVGGVSAANIANGATLANNATTNNDGSTIVKRDSTGGFSAGSITATGFNGDGSGLTNLNPNNVNGVLSVAKGGTGSSTQNFVDLSNNQSIGGNKTFNGAVTAPNFTGDGGALTGLSASNINQGTLNDERLSAVVQMAVVAANNASTNNDGNTIVKRDSTGGFSAGSITANGFNGDGSGLTNLNPNNVNGVLSVAKGGTGSSTQNFVDLSNNQSIGGNKTFNGPVTAPSFTGDGGALTGLSASNINQGTLADDRLSSNVALLGSANTFTANQTVNANLIQSGSLVQFTSTNGFVAGGTVGSGSIPATGAGARLMWYPNKAALRAGQVSNTNSTYWDDADIGIGSAAFGEDNRAGGKNSFAAGLTNTASGENSVALGDGATAGGERSLAFNGTASATGAIALGSEAQATVDDAVAIGSGSKAKGLISAAIGPCMASGAFSTCIGLRTEATGNFSLILGRDASSSSDSTNNTTYSGVIALGDGSTTAPSHTMYATANNQFNVRAVGGIRFFSACCNYDTGVTVSAGGGAWNSISDRNAKENFQPVAPRDILRRVLRLPISTWNYKAQKASIRHIGAMAQDFYAAFNVGENDKTISTIDPDGVALAAIQGLHEELKDRDARIERLDQQAKEQQLRAVQLEQQVKQQQAVIDGLRQLLCAQNRQAAVCQPEARK